MDWISYLVVFAGLFGFVAVILTIRFLVERRLENQERARNLEEQARQTAESNSGL